MSMPPNFVRPVFGMAVHRLLKVRVPFSDQMGNKRGEGEIVAQEVVTRQPDEPTAVALDDLIPDRTFRADNQTWQGGPVPREFEVVYGFTGEEGIVVSREGTLMRPGRMVTEADLKRVTMAAKARRQQTARRR
ncbi:MAG: hypothetical protein AB7P76_12095 [Candidatus Melainabacteria bacterium]